MNLYLKLKKGSLGLIDNLGIGIDAVLVKRFEDKPYVYNVQFYTKLFTASEIKFCLKFKDPYPHFAGKFAVKEALKKSIADDISILDIETSHRNSKPVIKLRGNKYNFLVSLSHEDTMAIAVVISEKK